MHEIFGPAEAILQGATHVLARVEVARTWLDENLRHAPGVARDLIETLLPEAEAAGHPVGAAWLRFHFGWLAIDADDYEQGMTALESARATFTDLGDHEGISRCLNALGFLHFSLGIHDLALAYCRASMSEAEQVGRPDLAGAAYINIAECLCALGESDAAIMAIEHCMQSVGVAPHNTHLAHTTAGLIYRSVGRLEEAERELLEAIDTAGDALHDALEARQVLAEIHADAGRLSVAEETVAAGLEACALAGERLIGTRFKLTRARLSSLKGRAAEAIPDIEAAIHTAQEIGARKLEAEGEKALYLAWQTLGDYQKALAAFVRHTRIHDAMQRQQTSRHISALHDERAGREARHFEHLYKQISAISEIGRRITGNLDFEATLESVYSAVNEVMDAPSLAIAVIDENQACLDYRLVMMQGERKDPVRVPLDTDSLGCWCIRYRSDLLIGDIDAEYDRYLRGTPPAIYEGDEKSMVYVPLAIGDKVSGMLTVQSHKRNAYDKRTVETVRAIGSYIAIAIENSRLFQRAIDSEKSLRQEHTALLNAQAELKKLHGIIPICSACKKIRDDGGSWHQLESYIRDHSEAEFTHGICPDCVEKLYGSYLKERGPAARE